MLKYRPLLVLLREAVLHLLGRLQVRHLLSLEPLAPITVMSPGGTDVRVLVLSKRLLGPADGRPLLVMTWC